MTERADCACCCAGQALTDLDVSHNMLTSLIGCPTLDVPVVVETKGKLRRRAWRRALRAGTLPVDDGDAATSRTASASARGARSARGGDGAADSVDRDAEDSDGDTATSLSTARAGSASTARTAASVAPAGDRMRPDSGSPLVPPLHVAAAAGSGVSSARDRTAGAMSSASGGSVPAQSRGGGAATVSGRATQASRRTGTADSADGASGRRKSITARTGIIRGVGIAAALGNRVRSGAAAGSASRRADATGGPDEGSASDTAGTTGGSTSLTPRRLHGHSGGGGVGVGNTVFAVAVASAGLKAARAARRQLHLKLEGPQNSPQSPAAPKAPPHTSPAFLSTLPVELRTGDDDDEVELQGCDDSDSSDDTAVPSSDKHDSAMSGGAALSGSIASDRSTLPVGLTPGSTSESVPASKPQLVAADRTASAATEQSTSVRRSILTGLTALTSLDISHNELGADDCADDALATSSSVSGLDFHALQGAPCGVHACRADSCDVTGVCMCEQSSWRST